MKVLVTGATGNTGRHVVSGLRDAGIDVRVLVRDATKAPGKVEVVQGDITDTADAAEGVDAVYLVWPFYKAEGIDKTLKPFKDKKIVYVSSAAAEDGGFWSEVEDAVTRITDDWTFLRVTGLATNTLGWIPQAKPAKSGRRTAKPSGPSSTKRTSPRWRSKRSPKTTRNRSTSSPDRKPSPRKTK
ncbi:NAD(P)H-binding protein [Amycolatopsis sp. NPDC051371]|uniref:SDR family oxidoreductase n=1 Tax=Amycolatopsis sp. NPDC051371 TaxID=3155800 RepID=UPI003441EB0D